MLSREDLKTGAGNFSWLLVGNYASQALSIVTVVLIARRLGPQAYGVLSTAVAFVGLFGMFRLAGFDKVFVREAIYDPDREDELRAGMLGLKSVVAVLGFLVTLAAVLMSSLTAAERFAAAVFATTIVTQAVVSLWAAVFQIHEDMKWLTLVNLVRQSSYIVMASLGLYLVVPEERYATFTVLMLALSYWVGLGLSLICVRRYAPRPLKMTLPRLPRSMYRAGVVFSAGTVVVFLYTKIDLLMIRAFIDTSAVGLYAVCLNTVEKIQSPLLLVTTAFFPTVVRRIREDRVLDMAFLTRACAIFGGLGALAAGAGAVGGAPVLLFLFGDGYAGSTDAFRVLLWSLVPTVAMAPVVIALQAAHHEELILRVALVRVALNVGLNWLFLAQGYGIVGVAWSSVITSTLFNTGFFVIARPRLLASVVPGSGNVS